MQDSRGPAHAQGRELARSVTAAADQIFAQVRFVPELNYNQIKHMYTLSTAKHCEFIKYSYALINVKCHQLLSDARVQTYFVNNQTSGQTSSSLHFLPRWLCLHLPCCLNRQMLTLMAAAAKATHKSVLCTNDFGLGIIAVVCFACT